MDVVPFKNELERGQAEVDLGEGLHLGVEQNQVKRDVNLLFYGVGQGEAGQQNVTQVVNGQSVQSEIQKFKDRNFHLDKLFGLVLGTTDAEKHLLVE